MEDFGSPTEVTTLRVSRGEVSCTDAARARLAAGGGDGVLRLWRWSAALGWLPRGECRAHRYGVTAARFAASGMLLASTGVDGAARVWGALDGLVERRVLAAPDAAAARSLCWATGERLAVGHDDGAVRVWAVRAGLLLAHMRPHEGAVYGLATPARVALLLTACTDGVLKVFDFEEVVRQGAAGNTGPTPLLWEDGAHDLGVLCATEREEGEGAATGGHDGRVRLWRVMDADAGAGHTRRVHSGPTLIGHTAAVTALRWTRELLVSASLDRTARLWNPNEASCVHVLHAHTRYLTCIALTTDLRIMITGSNDKSLRTWSLGNFTIDDDLEPECAPLTHFGLGDLQGIGAVDDEAVLESEEETGALCVDAETRCIWREPHPAAINCIAATAGRIVTACSDGWVRSFVWSDEDEQFSLRPERALPAHEYPALAVDAGGAGSGALLSAGLDGCARLWDVQSGCELATLSAESLRAHGAGPAGDEGGGGGVRDARVSPARPLRLLLATDDGYAALWGIDPPSPNPLHVFPRLAEGAACCSWAGGGGVLLGGAAGTLRLHAAPPAPALLAHLTDAHDLGVISCDFTSALNDHKSEDDANVEEYLLATGGFDALVKLWWVKIEDIGASETQRGSIVPMRALAAHGGAVQCVRWGSLEGALALATGGADRWARVWRVTVAGAGLEAQAMLAVPAGAAGGAGAVRLLEGNLLAVGSLSGALAVWRVAREPPPEEEGAEPRAWGPAGVLRWLREYVTRCSEYTVSESVERRLVERARGVTGPRLLDDPVEQLLRDLGYGSKDNGEYEDKDEDEDEDFSNTRERLRSEILWLRRDPLQMEKVAGLPHALLCPLTHSALREPARASDGFTYERQALRDWQLAAGPESSRSPLSGARLRAAVPNLRLRAQLMQYCGWREL